MFRNKTRGMASLVCVYSVFVFSIFLCLFMFRVCSHCWMLKLDTFSNWNMNRARWSCDVVCREWMKNCMEQQSTNVYTEIIRCEWCVIQNSLLCQSACQLHVYFPFCWVERKKLHDTDTWTRILCSLHTNMHSASAVRRSMEEFQAM